MEIITKGLETKVDSMKHHDDTHSVTIEIENAHVDLRTSFFATGGNYSKFTIFNLTPDQMKMLGGQIIGAAMKAEEDHGSEK